VLLRLVVARARDSILFLGSAHADRDTFRVLTELLSDVVGSRPTAYIDRLTLEPVRTLAEVNSDRFGFGSLSLGLLRAVMAGTRRSFNLRISLYTNRGATLFAKGVLVISVVGARSTIRRHRFIPPRRLSDEVDRSSAGLNCLQHGLVIAGANCPLGLGGFFGADSLLTQVRCELICGAV